MPIETAKVEGRRKLASVKTHLRTLAQARSELPSDEEQDETQDDVPRILVSYHEVQAEEEERHRDGAVHREQPSERPAVPGGLLGAAPPRAAHR